MRAPSPATVLYRLRSLFTPGTIAIGPRGKISLRTSIVFKKGEIRIGRSVNLHPGVLVDAQRGSIVLGDNVSMNHYSILYGSGGIRIGNNVRIAAHVIVVSFDHNYRDTGRLITSQGVTLKPVEIGDDVWIGAGAKILGGAQIATVCIIGANAVVKGKTEPYGIYAGNPARLIKRRGDMSLSGPDAGTGRSSREEM